MLHQLNKQVSFETIRSEIATLILPAITDTTSFEELCRELALHLNQLITTDFNRLIALLYRLDISEKKLKILLAKNKGEQAGVIIAQMIIERQVQKIIARNAFKNNTDVPDEDKW